MWVPIPSSPDEFPPQLQSIPSDFSATVYRRPAATAAHSDEDFEGLLRVHPALLDKLTKDGNAGKTIVMINGAPTDNNAKLFKAGAHSVLDGKFKIGAEYDTPDWSPDQAQSEMDQAITKLGKTGFVGVYCANDGTCGGAIAAMKGAGIDPKKIPSTGQDAELAGIQRILLGAPPPPRSSSASAPTSTPSR